MTNRMLIALTGFGAAVGLGAIATPALADDPNDPAMRDRALREADAAGVRQLNIDQARYVQQRDARYAEGWQRTREFPGEQSRYERDMDRYRESRADYEARMAAWRRAVQLCREGRYEYCD